MNEEPQKDEKLYALIAVGKHLSKLADSMEEQTKYLKEIKEAQENRSKVATLGLVALVLFLILLAIRLGLV